MKKTMFFGCGIVWRGTLVAAAMALCGAARGEMCIYDSFALDGAWEMSYRPNAWKTAEYPKFDGVRVAEAVPGLWEDMVPAFVCLAFACSPCAAHGAATAQLTFRK